MLASDSGHTEVAQLLLSSGAKIDLQNKVRHHYLQPMGPFTSLTTHFNFYCAGIEVNKVI